VGWYCWRNNHSKLCDSWFSGFRGLIPPVLPFSIGIASRPYSSLSTIVLHCDCSALHMCTFILTAVYPGESGLSCFSVVLEVTHVVFTGRISFLPQPTVSKHCCFFRVHACTIYVLSTIEQQNHQPSEAVVRHPPVWSVGSCWWCKTLFNVSHTDSLVTCYKAPLFVAGCVVQWHDLDYSGRNGSFVTSIAVAVRILSEHWRKHTALTSAIGLALYSSPLDCW